MRRRLFCCCLFAFILGLALALPATAGTVYVAMVADAEIDGVSYESVLRVTNTAAEPRFFIVHFVPNFTDGTGREGEPEPTLIGVPGGHTYVYENLSLGSGQVGMLELSGDAELVFAASLVVRNAQGDGEELPVPVIGSDEIVESGRRMVVQGVRRDGERLTSFGMLNLAHETIQCEVDLLAADGTQLMGTAVLALPPLSQSFYHDVVAVVGKDSLADARFETVCNGPAFTFGQTVDFVRGTAAPIRPSASLASSLVRPGEVPAGPQPGVCGGDFCFELPGTFHVPNPSNRVHKVSVDIPTNEPFSRLDIDLTVTHGGWFNGDPGGFHNFFWFFDGQWKNGTWGYVNARGPGRGIVTSLHNVNLTKGNRSEANLLLQPGTTYRVHYTYDAAGGRIETTFFDASGNVLARMNDVPSARKIVFGAPGGAWVWFGLEGHFAEVPSFGWQYKNFVLSLTK